ncbi:type II secretion system F family protein [Catellatospora sp. TT07R-123]|uniref:type II secretion system F family protein n=1 Tax=Catellatospora sp. TT07R-123 TaxID=2733863 RepID=UPI0035B53B1F
MAWTQRLARGGPAPAVGRAAGRRLRRLRLRPGQQSAPGRTRWLLALAAGAGTCLIVPQPAGLVAGAAVAAATELLLRRQEPAAVRLEREEAVGALAWAADLVAAALRAGVPLDGAVLAVAAALPGPLAVRLRRIGRSLRLGATPVEAWQHLADLPPAARLLAAVERSAASGTALAGALHRCADDLRADAGFRRQATAQRNAVLVVLPLGLCFLPAFVLAGLVPVVLAVLGEVL